MENTLSNNTSGGALEITGTLQHLTQLMEDALRVVSENRQMAIDHKENLEKQLKEIKKDSPFMMSEDGVIEAEITKTIKIINDSAKALQAPIKSITDLLKTKIIADATRKPSFFPGKKPITKPIDIDDYSPDEDNEDHDEDHTD